MPHPNLIRLLEEIREVLYRYGANAWVPSVRELDLEAFRSAYEDWTFDHEVVLSDGSTVFVIFGPRRKKGPIFVAWRFDRDGQFVDYVERTHPPVGASDYDWIDEVCTVLESEESGEG